MKRTRRSLPSRTDGCRSAKFDFPACPGAGHAGALLLPQKKACIRHCRGVVQSVVLREPIVAGVNHHVIPSPDRAWVSSSHHAYVTRTWYQPARAASIRGARLTPNLDILPDKSPFTVHTHLITSKVSDLKGSTALSTILGGHLQTEERELAHYGVSRCPTDPSIALLWASEVDTSASGAPS